MKGHVLANLKKFMGCEEPLASSKITDHLCGQMQKETG
jgi:hypothetical protein